MKNTVPAISLLLAVFVSLAVTGVCVSYILPVIYFFVEIVSGTSFSAYTSVLFKVCGIGILTRMGTELCQDAGENVYAGKIMMIGKTAILLCGFPVIKTLFEQIVGFME